jgi:hypothetical protein
LKRFLMDLPPKLDLHLGDPSEPASIIHPAPRKSTRKRKPHGMTPDAI